MEQLLKQFNFSGPEIKVYKELLKRGGATVSEIAKRTKLKRTSCQEVIRSLEERGFVVASKRGNILFYQTEDPDKFWQMVSERKFVVDRLVAELGKKEKTKKWSVRAIDQEGVKKIIRKTKRNNNIFQSFVHDGAGIITGKNKKIILYSTDRYNPAIEIDSDELANFHNQIIKNT